MVHHQANFSSLEKVGADLSLGIVVPSFLVGALMFVLLLVANFSKYRDVDGLVEIRCGLAVLIHFQGQIRPQLERSAFKVVILTLRVVPSRAVVQRLEQSLKPKTLKT